MMLFRMKHHNSNIPDFRHAQRDFYCVPSLVTRHGRSRQLAGEEID